MADAVGAAGLANMEAQDSVRTDGSGSDKGIPGGMCESCEGSRAGQAVYLGATLIDVGAAGKLAKKVLRRVAKKIRTVLRGLSKAPRGLPSGRTATVMRNSPGTAFGVGTKIEGQWLKQDRVGHVPEEVAARLRGRTFNDFDEFRYAFWEAVGQEEQLLKQFGPRSQREILAGRAPWASSGQRMGKGRSQRKWNLHHKKAIEHGGGVYDIDNILVSSPFHHSRGLH